MMQTSTYGKIIPSGDLERTLIPFKANGKKIVLCHGCFDLLHPGHVRFFEAAKKQGDVLVVTLTSDRFVNKGPGRPVFSQNVRAEFLSAIGIVDYVSIIDHPLGTEAINLVRPDVYVKGSEYEKPENDSTGGIVVEREAVEAVGGRVHFTQEETFSSTSLLNRHFDIFPRETQLFLNDFRQKYSYEQVIEGLERIRDLKVLLIGDAVIDEYHYVRPMNKVSKANIVASRFLNQETFIGGVFACANHLAGFCNNVHIVTSLGTQNTREDFIRRHLKPGVTTQFFYRDDCPTTVKRRYVDSNFLGKLFEVYFFEDRPLPDETDAELRAYLEKILPEYDVVISLDYAHGLISPKTVELLSERSRFLAVNTQTNAANIGFNPVLKYPKVDFVCIDEPELRLATWDRFGSVEPLLQKVIEKLGAKRGIVTRGHNGCLAMDENGSLHPVPVLSQKVVDAVGAGDAFLAIAAPCVATGLPMDLVGFIGNAVGAQAVLIVGNREFVEPTLIMKAVKTILA